MIWAGFVSYGLFFGLMSVYLYWGILFAPFMVLMISQMPRYLYLNLLLETLGYGGLVLGHASQYSNFFFGDTMKSMVMSRIVSEEVLNYKGSLIFHIVCQLSEKAWIFTACNSVFVAAVAAMAFLGYPERHAAEDHTGSLTQECYEMIVFRFLVTCGICMLPVMSLFI